MTSAVSGRLDSSATPARTIAVLATFVLGAVTLAAGCKSPKKKATEVIEDAHKKCRKAESDFHQVQLFAGDESTEVLAATCQEKMGEVKVEKGHSAEVDIGPYTWRAGIDESTGIWVLKGVGWEPLNLARERLGRQDPGKNEIKRAIDLLAKAQKQYPKSGWVRLKRLEALLQLRKKTRPAETKESYKLGDKVEKHLEETLEWAKSEGDRATAARTRLAIIDYYRSFARGMQDAKGALGANDEYYKKSIKVAERKGNEKEAEKYRKELEKMKKERPKKRKRYDFLIKKAHTQMCGRLSHLKSDGIEDSNLKKRVESTKESIDCRKLLKDDKKKDGNEKNGGDK